MLSSKNWISSKVKELIPIVESLVPTSIRGVHMFLIEKAPAEVFLEDRTTYPFENMDVGDSFLITDFRKAESARVSAIQFCKRKCKDWKFTQRKMDGGWRIIRIGWSDQKWVLQGPFLRSMIKNLSIANIQGSKRKTLQYWLQSIVDLICKLGSRAQIHNP